MSVRVSLEPRLNGSQLLLADLSKSLRVGLGVGNVKIDAVSTVSAVNDLGRDFFGALLDTRPSPRV